MAKTDSRGELINHFNAVRLRVLGSGNMLMKWDSLSETVSQDLLPVVMNPATNIEPTRISNFRQQRAALTVYVDEMDEWFKINRIVIFRRPVASGYPG